MVANLQGPDGGRIGAAGALLAPAGMAPFNVAHRPPTRPAPRSRDIGAFGDSIVKIGMTRRLEPLDRVYELSGAAVPFRFDVHALIFSKDAVGLETRLHQEFADRRVNRVNNRKEFFYVTPAEVRTALQRFVGEHLVEFTETPQALEWRAGRTG